MAGLTMARFKFTGTITVEGGSILTEQDAIDELRVMIDAHNDVDCWGNEVVIHWDKIEEI